jgi:hypothetical protein
MHADRNSTLCLLVGGAKQEGKRKGKGKAGFVSCDSHRWTSTSASHQSEHMHTSVETPTQQHQAMETSKKETESTKPMRKTPMQ